MLDAWDFQKDGFTFFFTYFILFKSVRAVGQGL